MPHDAPVTMATLQRSSVSRMGWYRAAKRNLAVLTEG
jgi:hypothetical protein